MGREGKPRFRFTRVLVINGPLSLLISLFTYSIVPGATLRDLGRYLAAAFTYSFCIGCLAHGLMPYLWAWSLPKRALVRRSLASVALTLIAAVGCFLASV